MVVDRDIPNEQRNYIKLIGIVGDGIACAYSNAQDTYESDFNLYVKTMVGSSGRFGKKQAFQVRVVMPAEELKEGGVDNGACVRVEGELTEARYDPPYIKAYKIKLLPKSEA